MKKENKRQVKDIELPGVTLQAPFPSGSMLQCAEIGLLPAVKQVFMVINIPVLLE